VRVVTRLGLVLDVRDRNSNTTLALFGRLVDHVERRSLVQVRVLVMQHLGDRRCQRRLSMVNVTNGADIDVGLSPLELCLRHWGLLITVMCPVLPHSPYGVGPFAVLVCCIRLSRWVGLFCVVSAGVTRP
jgi:hypothetical protein